MSERKEMSPLDYVNHFSKSAILCSCDKDGKPNMMALDWKMIGDIGYEPIIVVAVASTRYTFKCLTEGTQAFTLNIVSDRTKNAFDISGSCSGSSIDKFKKSEAETYDGIKGVPTIKHSLLSYECEVVGHSQIPFKTSHYAFYGKIEKAYASVDIK